jgi:hypothetical protein
VKRVIICILVASAALAVWVFAFGGEDRSSATNDEPHKVFVCKYVGTPGDDERLQTGQNPISVDIASLDGPPVIGQFFTDKQGRSVVIAFDTGQPEPPVTACPTVLPPPPGPTTTTAGPTTTTAGPTTTTAAPTTTTAAPTTTTKPPTTTTKPPTTTTKAPTTTTRKPPTSTTKAPPKVPPPLVIPPPLVLPPRFGG